MIVVCLCKVVELVLVIVNNVKQSLKKFLYAFAVLHVLMACAVIAIGITYYTSEIMVQKYMRHHGYLYGNTAAFMAGGLVSTFFDLLLLNESIAGVAIVPSRALCNSSTKFRV